MSDSHSQIADCLDVLALVWCAPATRERDRSRSRRSRNPFPSSPGFTWDVAGPPDPDNGHCFIGVAYDPKGVQIDTWGMLGHLTDAAIAKYASTAGQGELYAVLSPEIITRASRKAANGFNFAQLQADFAAL